MNTLKTFFDSFPALVPTSMETNFVSSSLFDEIDKLFNSQKLRQISIYPTDVYYQYTNGIKDACIIDIALAGMNKDNCEVKINGNKLTVEVGLIKDVSKPIVEELSGTTTEISEILTDETPTIEYEYLVKQIANRHSIMNWSLSNNINKKKITVNFDNGILKIVLPLLEKEETETLIAIN